MSPSLRSICQKQFKQRPTSDAIAPDKATLQPKHEQAHQKGTLIVFRFAVLQMRITVSCSGFRNAFLPEASSMINPFKSNGLFYLHSLDRSISSIRGVWLEFL